MASRSKVSRPKYIAPGAMKKNHAQHSNIFPPGFGAISILRSSSCGITTINANTKKLSSIVNVGSNESDMLSNIDELPREVEEEINYDYTREENEEISLNNEATSDNSMREESDTASLAKKRKRDRNPRGGNKCNEVASLEDGQKLNVEFFQNGLVGNNHKALTRHMGKLIRDRNIVPVRVHSWNDINESVKEHLWQAVLNKFSGPSIELRRETTLNHMKRLWQNWRGMLHRDNIKKFSDKDEVLKKVPINLTKEDWKWLVEEHYGSEKFQKISVQNSDNRSHMTMPHRTGSMPFRQVIWERMGGKNGNQPLVSQIFKETRTRKCGTLNEDDSKKYDEIMDVERKYPSISIFEVIEKCFGPQDNDHVVCFGLGMVPKDVRGSLPTRVELTTQIQERERENNDLRICIDDMEVERAAHEKKINSLEEKVNILMTMAFGQNSSNIEGDL